MPEYNFTCPKSDCKAASKVTSDRPIAGTRRVCGRCKAEFTVPLSCPSCPQPSQELDTPDGLLGGRRFICPQGHAFTVPIVHEEVIAKMKTLGSQVGEFQQGQRAASLAQPLRDRVSGGYCAGICLDWIRRVVQAGRASYEVSPYGGTSKRSEQEIQSREAGQTHRGAQAWVTRSKEELEKFKAEEKRLWEDQNKIAKRQAKSTQLSSQLEDLKAKSTEAYEKYSELHTAYNVLVDVYNHAGSAAEQVSMKPRLDDGEAAYRKAHQVWRRFTTERDEVLAGLNKVVDKLSAANQQQGEQIATPVLQRFWGSYARTMDQFEMLRRMEGGKFWTVSKRPFSDLKVVMSAQPFESYIGSFVTMLLAKPEFAVTYAAILGFDKLQSQTGHAVAVHKLNTGKFHLFDPNYGIFEFDAAPLGEALCYLFEQAYDGYISSSGKAKIDYTVFAHEGPAPPPSVLQLAPETADQRPQAPIQLSPAKMRVFERVRAENEAKKSQATQAKQ